MNELEDRRFTVGALRSRSAVSALSRTRSVARPQLDRPQPFQLTAAFVPRFSECVPSSHTRRSKKLRKSKGEKATSSFFSASPNVNVENGAHSFRLFSRVRSLDRRRQLTLAPRNPRVLASFLLQCLARRLLLFPIRAQLGKTTTDFPCYERLSRAFSFLNLFLNFII